MKFGIFYEHQMRAAVGRRTPSAGSSRTRSTRSSWPTGSASSTCGRWSTTSSRSTATRRRPRSSWPRAASARRTSASATGSSSPRRGSTTRPAPPSGSPCSTSSRTAASSSASGESSSDGRARRLRHRRSRRSGTPWLEGLEVAVRCMTETPFTGVEGRFVSMPPRNVVPKPMQKPHPPLWVACSRRDTILLAAEKGIGALTFAFIDPEEAAHWVADYERDPRRARASRSGLAVNPQVACVTPMMLHHDEETAIRRGIEGGQLLRLLARPLLRLRRAPPGRAPTCGRSSWTKRGERRATTPRSPPGPSRRRRSAPSWPPATRTGLARRHRHARPGARATSAATRRPASTR